MSRPSVDYLAAQAVIFEGRVTCPNCGGKGVGRVPGWREPLVTCPLCQAEMRSPFTGLTTVTAAEADVWIADTSDADETAHANECPDCEPLEPICDYFGRILRYQVKPCVKHRGQGSLR